MSDDEIIERTARTYAQSAGAAYAGASQYLRTIPDDEWTGPTGCAQWDIRTLVGHIVGEAVWFPNLTRGVTQHEAPYPNDLYESLKTLPPAAIADRLLEAAEALPTEIAAASPSQLQEDVDLGWTHMPLWQATYVALSEAVYHDWVLHTADQYVRLVAGRLPLQHALEQGTVTATGDQSCLVGLNRIVARIGGS